jgi:hypothetical protein
MRVGSRDVLTDHAQLPNQTAHDHHNSAYADRILINSVSIPASGDTEVRIALDKTGYRMVWGVLRGTQTVDIQGHEGLFFLARDATAKSSSIGIRRYGAGGYPTSYVGAYSRIHGDSYLSHPGTFGSSNYIRIRDIYLDDDDLVLLVNNAAVISQSFTCYGAFCAK